MAFNLTRYYDYILKGKRLMVDLEFRLSRCQLNFGNLICRTKNFVLYIFGAPKQPKSHSKLAKSDIFV